MQRIRVERKPRTREYRERYVVLPLDPRDPDILRAKRLATTQSRLRTDR